MATSAGCCVGMGCLSGCFKSCPSWCGSSSEGTAQETPRCQVLISNLCNFMRFCDRCQCCQSIQVGGNYSGGTHQDFTVVQSQPLELDRVAEVARKAMQSS